MAISKMIVFDKCIKKKLANSEANIFNQIRGIKDSSVSAYYLCDIYEYENVKYFFQDIHQVIVDEEEMRKYERDVNTKLLKYSKFYKKEMKLARSSMTLLTGKIELSNIQFEARGSRMFFFFSKKTDNDFKFTKSIIGGVTNICFKRKDNILYVSLELIENPSIEIFNSKTNVELHELAEILKIYAESHGSIDVGILKFGIDFSFAIERYKFDPIDIVEIIDYKDPDILVNYIRQGIALSKILDKEIVVDKQEDFEHQSNIDLTANEVIENSYLKTKQLLKLNPNRYAGGFNKIYYGIPGSGKSYEVDSYLNKNINSKENYDKNVFRTTFYLDYSNTDFVGQLLPKTIGEKVIYAPSLGPFARALKRAYETEEMIYLVIEEINRGNTAAIFGDLFQLLDRLDEKKATNILGAKVGDSEYPITNTFLEDYLGIEEGKVIIPSNMTIIATMNTSDQNVFPLDNAFKRRWIMHKTIDDAGKSIYKDYYIPQKNNNTPITWSEFLNRVNAFIIESEEGINLEDKQIGSYFIKDDILIKDINSANDERIEQFNYKVLEYIWSDVSKFDRDRWFEPYNIEEEPRSFDKLVELVNKYGLKRIMSAFNYETSE